MSIFDPITDLLGGGLSNALGMKNNEHYNNPYDEEYLKRSINNQGQIYGQQQNLAQALQQQMAGQGPNPAQTQFMGNAQNNIANAQGLIASQRGLNPALAARMGANAASHANQQAALGSALLQQQQQLGATSNLGNLYGQMQQGNLGYQQNYNNAQQSAQGLNAKVSEANTSRNSGMIGGLLNAAGGALSGGLLSGIGGGGMSAESLNSNSNDAMQNKGYYGFGSTMGGGYSQGGQVQGSPQVAGDSQKNDTVHAMLSPGEIVVPRSMAHDPEKAKEFIDHLLKGEKKTGDYGEVVKARRKKAGK